MIVIGIDPTSGANSLLGISAIDYAEQEIILSEQILVPKEYAKSLHKRIVFIYETVSDVLGCFDPNEDTRAFFESTVMRGKGGESLARATGAIMAGIPSFMEAEPIHNTTVKLIVGGSGNSDKLAVARGVLKWAQGNEASEAIVREAIQMGQWDKIDSLAIAIAGFKRV